MTGNNEDEKEAKRELVDIRPDKVSLVDLGANDAMFFFAKRANIMKSTEKATALKSFLSVLKDNVGSFIAMLNDAEIDDGIDSPEEISLFVSDMVKMFDEIQKTFSGEDEQTFKIAGSERDKLVVVFSSIGDTIESLVSEIDNLDEESIRQSLQSLSDSITMAVWSTAYINDLPDSAFLYIKPGGKKDSDGKTVPRTNRMFPYKNKEGAVDLPHLRNAIARIPQASISDELKTSLQTKARNILAKETKKSVDTEEETMGQYAELAKGSKDVELDLEETKKQASSAKDKLELVLNSLAMSSDDVTGDMYEVRWKLGEAVDILIRAAKLEDMLGSSTDAKKAETEVKEESATETKKTEADTEPKHTEIKKAEVVSETKPNSTENLSVVIKAAILEATKPLSEKLTAIEEKVAKNEEIIEKTLRERDVAHGGNIDTTMDVRKSDAEEESVFASIMPERLRGKVTYPGK